jgi:hypothetical protein
MKDFFKTKYRIVHKDGWYNVQEHEWWDLIYGWWWHVDNSRSLSGAQELIKRERERRAAPVVVHKG